MPPRAAPAAAWRAVAQDGRRASATSPTCSACPRDRRLFCAGGEVVHEVQRRDGRAVRAERQGARCCCWATASPTSSASSRWAGATSAGLGAAAGPGARPRRGRDRSERRGRARHPPAAVRRARGRRGSPGRQDGGGVGARLARAGRRRLQDRSTGPRCRGRGSAGPMRRRSCLVTGAAGEVGRRLVRRLVADGWRVRGLVLPGDPLRARLDGTGCEIVEGDIRGPRRSAAAVAGVDAVLPPGGGHPRPRPARSTTRSTGAAPRTWSPRPRRPAFATSSTSRRRPWSTRA